MSTRVNITTTGGDIGARLAKANAEMQGILRRIVFESGADMVNTAKARYRTAGGEPTRTATAVRTGNLRNSYSHAVTSDTGSVTLEFGVRKATEKGNALEYAALHEYGGTITPKRGQYLTIPLFDQQTKFGGGTTAAGAGRVSPRNFPRGWFLRTNGKLFFVQADPRSDQLEWLFLLVKSSTVRARPSLKPSLDRHLPDMRERIAAAVVASMQGLGA